MRTPFSCFIIGEGSLLIQCMDILVEHGHHILGVISKDRDVIQSAQEQQLSIYDPSHDTRAEFHINLITLLQKQPFDYLFSIVNVSILPNEILKLPTRYAINFHNGPLPKYAGTYAPSWAILNREVQHGITWHVMTEEIDAGDILKQPLIDIAPSDTALTLNAKCYEAGLTAFRELIDELSHDQLTLVPQNLAERSYFARYQRPPAGGVIAWQQAAEDIDALSRACTFGAYPNDLTLPKIALGDDLLIVTELELGGRGGTAPPGTIVSIDAVEGADATLTVATGSREVIIKTLLTIDGAPLSIRDLVASYDLRVGQQLPAFPPLAADALTAQTHKVARHEAFWRRRLATLQPIEPPFRKASGKTASDHVTTLSLPISDEVMAVLQARDWTPHHFLLTLFAVYLTRLNDIDYFDLALTTAAPGPEVEGFFAPHIPLRVAIDGDWSFERAYQALARERALCARRQTYARDMAARYPELRAKPELQDILPISVTISPGFGSEALRTDGLMLYVAEQETGVRLATIAYQPDLFEKEMMGSMVGHLQTLMAAATAVPEQPVKTLPLLTAAERHQILFEWNRTEADYPTGTCIQQLFEAQVDRTPDSVAVIDDAQAKRLTYGELNERANQLAHELRTLGVGPGTLVGICVERSIEIVIGLLGILKAGGAYVPLDPTYPKERLAFMADDARMAVLVTQAGMEHVLPEHGAQVVDLNAAHLQQKPRENPPPLATADHLAYIIYTSGSTGKPKGVMISHRAAVNTLRWLQETFDLDANHVVAQKTPASFTDSVWEFFWPLTVGSKLVMIADDVVKAPDVLYQHLRDYQVTVTQFVPPLMMEFLDALRVTGEADPLPHLQWVFNGGEALPVETARAWYAQFRRGKIANIYGMTESAIYATHHILETGPSESDVRVLIGKPIANAKAYVVDHHGQLCPPGIIGELCIGGVGLADGYLNRPELTAEQFVRDPFRSDAAARMYKTGDLGRYLPDGNLEYFGRRDHQVNIRGFRVELGEIETTLAQHSDVWEPVVVARDFQDGQELVAYIVPEAQASRTTLARTLRTHLQQTLPVYMIPAAFVVLDQFPLTPSGKIDRRALPAPERGRANEAPPRTPTEAVLVNIWAEVLGAARLGREDHFFELGGHSLLAMRVVTRMRDAFQVELSVTDIFESPTIAALAQTIEAARQTEQHMPAPTICAVSREGEAPLSFAQQRLWFMDQYEGASATYNIPAAFRLTLDPQGKPLQMQALETAFNQLIERHESLRTTFPATDGQPGQRIHPVFKHPLTVIDLQSFDASAQEDELERQLRQEVEQPFDLAQGPLLRARLYWLSETEQILQLTLHHIISDAWSMEVLARDLAALYQAALTDQPARLPDLTVQYADFAQWQRNWLQGEVLETQLAYWQDQLADAPTLLNLPTDHPRPLDQTFNGDIERFELDAELTAKVRGLSRRLGTSLFMTYYAAFAVLMSRYSGQEDIVIGSPIAHRHYREIEPLIGFFLNNLALRTDLSGDPSFADLAVQVRRVTLDAYAHQDVPFEQLVEELVVERNLSHTPLFQVTFVWLDQSPSVMLGDIRMERFFLPTVNAKFDLSLFLEQSRAASNGVEGVIEYNTDLFERATIERLIVHFRQLLNGIVANPQQLVNRLPLLTEAERRQILVEWNDTVTAYPRDKCIHELFEEQVERMPRAIAVVFEDQQLTYAELNTYANQLAHHLQSRGVCPEMLIGLSVSRSLDMIVGMLGILKAGGAYLPLDPDYPAERLAFMLDDAQAPLLLTQQQYVERFAEHAVPRLCLDTDWPTIATESPENPPNRLGPESLAYVVYTSGSTGRPKGVMVPHCAVNRLVNHTNYVEITPQDRIAQASNASFDAATFEIWGALLHGACLVGIPRDVILSPQRLAVELKALAISILFLTTALFNQVVNFAPQAFDRLRYLLFGGEAVDLESVHKLLDHGAPEHFLHVYGPTENTTFSTWYPIDRVGDNAMTAPIGAPIANSEVYILDSRLEPVPVGVPGELYLGGDGLALGYLNRPKLTEERFISSAFGSGTLYKTGDLVRYRPDGNIEFIGRTDHQVKIRGFRVELGEIESVMGAHPGVLETVVVARDDQGRKALAAYIVPHEPTTPVELISTLRAHLKQTLPDYMMPSDFVVLDHLPLTPNGKIDRQGLPAPEREVDEPSYMPPQTPIEEALTTIWSEVLDVERVGVHDNFFELGGHSLLATQVTSRVASAFGLNLPVRDIFERPTIAQLAERIEDDQLVLTLQDASPPMSSERNQDEEEQEDEIVL